MTPAQLRAARSLLGWSRKKLDQASGVSAATIKSIETGRFHPKQDTVDKLIPTLARHGVGLVHVAGRKDLWGVLFLPLHAGNQDNTPLTPDAYQTQAHLTLVDRMATKIRAITRDGLPCRPDELQSHGFTPAEIAEAWPMAKALAEVAAVGEGES